MTFPTGPASGVPRLLPASTARRRATLFSASTLTAVLTAGLVTAPSAGAATIDDTFMAARNSLYAAAYETQQAAKVGVHTIAVDSEVDPEGSVLARTRTVAWVANTWAGAVGAAVREQVYVDGKVRTFASYGSADVNVRNPNVLTGWYALKGGGSDTPVDARILGKLRDSVRYVTAPTPGVTNSRYLPMGVLDSLEMNGRVPWAVDERLWMCTQEELLDLTVQCTGSVTGEGNAKTWVFTVSLAGDSMVPDTLYTITAESNADGLITRRTVDTTGDDSPLTSRTETSVREFFTEWGQVPTPLLTAKVSVSSGEFTKIVGRTVATALAKNFRERVRAVLDENGRKLTKENMAWAVRKLDANDSGWWSPDTVHSSWTTSTGFGDPGNGSFQLFAVADDDLTAVEMAATVSVTKGKFVTVVAPRPTQ